MNNPACDAACKPTASVFSAIPRTANHWWEPSGVEARSLLKLYGIRFDILVTGKVLFRAGEGSLEVWEDSPSPRGSAGVSQAGKFALIPTAITLGTGAAWLGMVSLRFTLAAVTTSQGLLASAEPAYCVLGEGLTGEGGKVRNLEHGRSCPFQVTFLCDLLLLYVDREASFYWRTKYEEVSCGLACVPELKSLPEHWVLPHTFGGSLICCLCRRKLQRQLSTLHRSSWLSHVHPAAQVSQWWVAPAPCLLLLVSRYLCTSGLVWVAVIHWPIHS